MERAGDRFGLGFFGIMVSGAIALCLIAGGLVSILAAVTSCGPTGSDFGSAPVVVGNSGSVRDIRVASWNTYAYNSTGRIVAGIAEIGRTADVIGVQELNPERRRNAVERALPEYGVSAGNNSVQILWRKATVQLMAQDSVKVFDVERIESGVAGTSIGPKSIQWVQLRQLSTGAVFFVVNHHIVPSIENGGRPDDRKPRRIALYERQIEALTKLVTKLRTIAPVMVTGDFNVDARADARVQDPRWPYVRLGSQGLWSSWRAVGEPASGTHGRRLIDYVWVTMASARPTAQTVLGRYGSDHNALVVTLNGAGSLKPSSSPPPMAAAAQVAADRQAPRSNPVPTVVGLSGQQMRTAQAAYIATVQVAKEQDWSPAATEHAAVIVLSTSLKESDLLADPNSRRPDRYGDMGLLGQRTRLGWYGRPAQVLDPGYAVRAFLLGHRVTQQAHDEAVAHDVEPAGAAGYLIPGLIQVKGWETLSVSVAQHRVQHSAFPTMPPRLEALGQALVAAFKRTISPDSIGPGAEDQPADPCATQQPQRQGPSGPDSGLDCPATQMAGERGLKPSALYAFRCVADKFPQIHDIGGYYKTNAGEHPLYRAIDIMIPAYDSPDGIALGTEIADWVRTNAKAMNVMYVVWRKKIWNTQRDAEGWRQCGTPAAGCYAGNDPSAAHLNHVHVSVYPGNPPGFPKTTSSDPTSGPDLPTEGAAWIMPIADGSYRIGCSIACYPGHTGQDFPAADGTNLVSATAGTVVRSEALRNDNGNYRSYGNLIVIRPTGQPGTEIFYAHLSTRDVRAGQTVTPGQHIGRTGNTGNSKGPHLHFEIRIGGNPHDPIPILRRYGVQP